MIELFHQRGMSREDAEVVITRMAKYKDFFVNIMMTEVSADLVSGRPWEVFKRFNPCRPLAPQELALPLPVADASAESLKDGFIMFLSFAIFGMLPVLGFVCVPVVAPGKRFRPLLERTFHSSPSPCMWAA